MATPAIASSGTARIRTSHAGPGSDGSAVATPANPAGSFLAGSRARIRARVPPAAIQERAKAAPARPAPARTTERLASSGDTAVSLSSGGLVSLALSMEEC